MHAEHANGRLVIRFQTEEEGPEAAFRRAVERFTAQDGRWRSILEMSAAMLSDQGRAAFAAALDLLPAGPAPRLMMFRFEPDDQDRFRREAALMADQTLLAIGLMLPVRLGPDHPETASVEGLVTAVHRFVRIAKARP